jgi:hypothetical protein
MPSRTVETYGERDAFEAKKAELACQIGITMIIGAACLQGDVVGEVTAREMYRRRTRAVATGAGFALNSPTGTVDDASVFVAGDVLKNAAGAVIGTVSSVAPAGAITLTANAAVAVAAGAAVLGSDGSQTAKAIADEAADGTAETQIPVFVCGLLLESRLRGLDDSAKSELGGASVAGGIFKF